MVEKKICPECKIHIMVKKILPNGKFILFCEKCNLKGSENFVKLRKG